MNSKMKTKPSHITSKTIFAYFFISLGYSLLAFYSADFLHGKGAGGLSLNDARMQFFLPHIMHSVITLFIVIFSVNSYYMKLPLYAKLRMKNNTELVFHQYLTVLVHAVVMTLMLAIEWALLVNFFVSQENRSLPAFVIPSSFILYFMYALFVCSLLLFFCQLFRSIKMGTIAVIGFILLEMLTVNGAFYFIGQFKSLAWWCMLGFEEELILTDAIYPMVTMFFVNFILFLLNCFMFSRRNARM